MPTIVPHTRGPISSKEVADILSGRDCNGERVGNPLPFPRQRTDLLIETLRAVSEMAQASQTDALSTIDHRTQLVRKLARWATVSPEDMRNFDFRCAIARACVEQPDWTYHCGVPALLRQADQLFLKSADLLPEEDIDKPCLARGDVFTVYELLTQRHLIDEAEQAGNCLATEADTYGDDGSPSLQGGLIYWHRIKSRRSRLFSIRWSDTGDTYGTAEYSYRYKAITNLEFYGDCASFCMRDAIGSLVKALRASLPELKLRFLLLPQFTYFEDVLTRDGCWVPFDPEMRSHFLAGGISMPPAAPADVVNKLIGMPGVSLSFEHPDTADLLAQIHGDIVCREFACRHDFWPSGITGVLGAATFPFLSEARFPHLRSICGSLSLKRLIKAEFPALLSVPGRLIIRAAQDVSFPALTTVEGGLSLSSFDKRDFPMLTRGGQRIGANQ